jgi:RecA/RadA recombinase
MELVGEECSGRTSIALSFLARITASRKVCAWIEASNYFNPASAATAASTLSGYSGRVVAYRTT